MNRTVGITISVLLGIMIIVSGYLYWQGSATAKALMESKQLAADSQEALRRRRVSGQSVSLDVGGGQRTGDDAFAFAPYRRDAESQRQNAADSSRRSSGHSVFPVCATQQA